MTGAAVGAGETVAGRGWVGTGVAGAGVGVALASITCLYKVSRVRLVALPLCSRPLARWYALTAFWVPSRY